LHPALRFPSWGLPGFSVFAISEGQLNTFSFASVKQILKILQTFLSGFALDRFRPPHYPTGRNLCKNDEFSITNVERMTNSQ
jgi:hypothetical protein